MTSYNFRGNLNTINDGLNRNQFYKPDPERGYNLYKNRMANQNVNNANKNQSKGYKYTYFRDPNEFHYHSKQSFAYDTAQENSGLGSKKDMFSIKKQNSFSKSPSFKRNDYQSRQFMDSIENILESHRQKHHKEDEVIESEQILFLKDKLIETHQKLLKQLEESNRLSFEVENLQVELEEQQKITKSLELEVESLKKQVHKVHCILQQNEEKKEQKFQSIQKKAFQESKRNEQLKGDLQNMRNKMLEILRLKNEFEEQAQNYKGQLGKRQQVISKANLGIKEKDDIIAYLQRQLETLKKRFEKCQKQCEQRGEEIHQYNHLASEREKTIHNLEAELKMQKEKNSNMMTQFVNLQAEMKGTQKKLAQAQDSCQKYKAEIYWFQKNSQSNDKMYKEKLQKLTEQFNTLNIILKEKDKQIEMIRFKDTRQNFHKKKNYENTKQFVNTLQNQQTSVIYARDKTKSRSHTKPPPTTAKGANSNNQTTVRNNSKSPAPKSTKLEIPVDYEPITQVISQSYYPEQRSKYISILDHVGDLEQNLLSLNTEKKKMITELDRIDDTKVKTKDMIAKRRRLEDEIKTQDDHIKRVKDQLKKAKAL